VRIRIRVRTRTRTRTRVRTRARTRIRIRIRIRVRAQSTVHFRAPTTTYCRRHVTLTVPSFHVVSIETPSGVRDIFVSPCFSLHFFTVHAVSSASCLNGSSSVSTLSNAIHAMVTQKTANTT
jgi:hypothetical protein